MLVVYKQDLAMSLSAYDIELLDSTISRYILSYYENNNGEFTIGDVERRLWESGFDITGEIRLVLPIIVDKWVCHLERKKAAYIKKSNNVTWLTDSTYDLEIAK